MINEHECCFSYFCVLPQDKRQIAGDTCTKFPCLNSEQVDFTFPLQCLTDKVINMVLSVIIVQFSKYKPNSDLFLFDFLDTRSHR